MIENPKLQERKSFRLRQSVDRPGPCRFEGGNGGVLCQDVAQFVNPFEQTVFRKRVDGKYDRGSIGKAVNV